MIFIYPTIPYSREVDPSYKAEFDVAENKCLYDLETKNFYYADGKLWDHRINGYTNMSNQEIGIYRGWMLNTPEYTDDLQFHACLRRIRLINDIRQYTHCHHYANNYHLRKKKSAKSQWVNIQRTAWQTGRVYKNTKTEKAIELALSKFDGPVLIKDFVKSLKGDIRDNLIEDPKDIEAAKAKIDRFIEKRGDQFSVGIVFREFKNIKKFSNINCEYRLWILDKKVIYSSLDIHDWRDMFIANWELPKPPIEEFQPIIDKIESNFFTIDLAITEEGEWFIVELGDGQVSGLPLTVDIPRFYEKLGQIQ